MEINPFDSRLRMLQQMDGVQMQRETAPDEETAGCPGCPYFWTCPVPHRGEEVRAPAEINLEDVRDVLGPRREYSPRDESDIGWTDVWVDEEGLRIEPEERPETSAEVPTEAPTERPADGAVESSAGGAVDESAAAAVETSAEEPVDEPGTAPSPRGWRRVFRRRQ